MSKEKKFDCVQMKWDIQSQMLREFSGMSDEEAHKIQMAEVMQNPVLGPFCKRVRSVKRPSRK